MAKYGYYSDDLPSVNSGTNDDRMNRNIPNSIEIDKDKQKEAIKKFQGFIGINPTGNLDRRTKSFMKRARCGEKDLINEDDHYDESIKKRNKRFTLQGTKWHKKILTWRVNNRAKFIAYDEVVEIAKMAFDKWQKYLNIKFQQVLINASSKTTVDIDISFVREYHGDNHPFDGRGGVIAHAYYPLDNKGISGDIHLDDDEIFIGNNEISNLTAAEINDSRKLIWVFMHEIGHVLGLEHSKVHNSIMYPWYPKYTFNNAYDLSNDDISGIQSIYGPVENNDSKGIIKVVEFTRTMSTENKTSRFIPTLPPISPTECLPNYRTIFVGHDYKIYVISQNGELYILGQQLGIDKGPYHISFLFPGVNGSLINAVVSRPDHRYVVFMNKKFNVFYDKTLESIGELKDLGLPESLLHIDAAFIWSTNNLMYTFSKNDYWRHNPTNDHVEPGYPKKIILHWLGVISPITAVFSWVEKRTFFFKENYYWRFLGSRILIDSQYPKSTANVWFKCEKFKAKIFNS